MPYSSGWPSGMTCSTSASKCDNQLHALRQHPEVIPEVRARMEHLLVIFETQLAEVEAEITAALRQDSAWAAAAQRLQSITGVGWVTAAWTLVSTLNFTTCDTVEALTAYAGLAPMPRQSGTSVWHRPAIGHTGNGRLRTALYMATLSAAQHNPVIKTFYGRLRAAGKPEKVARCAAARKLLHIAWAVVKKDQAFDPLCTGVEKPLDSHYRIFALTGPYCSYPVSGPITRGKPPHPCTLSSLGFLCLRCCL